LPEPANGRNYSKAEFLFIKSMMAYKKERSTLINNMAYIQVLVGRALMYKALSRERLGHPNCPWNAKGLQD
jgi:hypothetical protein